jgi:hypothetical protein
MSFSSDSATCCDPEYCAERTDAEACTATARNRAVPLGAVRTPELVQCHASGHDLKVDFVRAANSGLARGRDGLLGLCSIGIVVFCLQQAGSNADTPPRITKGAPNVTSSPECLDCNEFGVAKSGSAAR